ncbi:MAG: FadR/GntR family transcriptional regulator [bacterium]
MPSDLDFIPLKTESRRKAVQDQIKDFIVRNRLKPGDKLPTEKELTDALQVSRTSLREGLKSLEALGLIEARVGEGMFVRSFSFNSILENLPYSILTDRKGLLDSLEVRRALECHFVGEAIRRIGEEDVVKLRGILAGMKEAAGAGDQERYRDLDIKFHLALFGRLENKLLSRLIEIFWTLFNNVRNKDVTEERDLMGSYERHRHIVEAVEAQDGEAARATMLHHFDSAEERIRGAKSLEGQLPHD